MTKQLLERLRVLATALPTWLALFALAAPELAHLAAQLLPGGERVAAVILTAAGVATFVITAVRRLTPVAKDERGVLPRG